MSPEEMKEESEKYLKESNIPVSVLLEKLAELTRRIENLEEDNGPIKIR